jgi:peptide/nickel transport system permease protein
MLRFFRTRSARKFFRQKMAVGALIVTIGYLLVSLLVAVGWITRDEANAPVGPRHVSGFFVTDTPEKRIGFAEFYLERADAAAKKIISLQAASQAELSKLSGEKKLAAERATEKATHETFQRAGFLKLQLTEMPADKLQAIVDRGWKLYEKLAVSEELNERPQLQAQLEELERLCAELYPQPAGWNGFVHRLHMSLGTDRQGRSIFLRAVYSIKVAIKVGIVTALAAVLIGTLLGGAAAFFGGWIDHAVTWLYTMLSSIPYMVLLIVLVYAFMGTVFDGTLIPLYVAMIATFWIGPCRVMRGETLKLKEMEYVQAAQALGFGRWYTLLRHVLPNAAHLMLINFSLLFIGAIKSEVILSFLGLGVKGESSWGIMISQSGSEVITGFYWQIGAATAFMFFLVLAFNILSDAIQDAYDPKHNG